MRIYVFTIKHKKSTYVEEEHTNKIVRAANVKEAINRVHSDMKDHTKFLIENIYSEEE